MQPTELQAGRAHELAGAPCASCGLLLAPALLACPKCRALVHRGELEQIASAADAASARGELAEAMAGFRRALALLPLEA